MTLLIVMTSFVFVVTPQDLQEKIMGVDGEEHGENPEIDVPSERFTAREYQQEIFECAKKENTIACLGTGTGKTYIAVMLIKYMSHEIRPSLKEGGKKTVFLVPTVPLVTQQATVLRDHTDLKIGGYYGSLGIDCWSKERWLLEFEENQVLVMTAEIFRIILHHSFLKVSQVNLVVFDECHRAVGSHPYAEIMKCFDTTDARERPRVLGLTASILNGKCKPHRVEKELKELEITLTSVGRVTKNLLTYNKYGTKPKQFVVCYSSDNPIKDFPHLQNTIAFLRTMVVKFYDRSSSIMKKLNKFMVETNESLLMLGPWCAMTLAQKCTEEIDSWLKNKEMEQKEIQACECAIEDLRTVVALISSTIDSDSLLTGISPKLKKLLEILQATQTWYKEELCSIVFVQKRVTASSLYDWLNCLSTTVSEYNFIKCNFVVGHGATSIDELMSLDMTTKKQGEIIAGFHDKKYNLIIATSVIEEGLDVPKCNLVIRYDFPMDYRSYIQSKGRARARKSAFILMVSDEENEKCQALENLTNYDVIEDILYKRCFDRQPPTAEDIAEQSDANEELPPYMPIKQDGCPRITMSSAISLINRYCMLLPSSIASRLKPNYKTVEICTSTLNGPIFQCTLYLPMNSTVKDPIVGDIMGSKRKAEMAAALKACELLHNNGELDENLLPMKNEDVLLSDDDEEEEDDDENNVVIQMNKRGTKKRVTYYPKEIASPLRGEPPSVSKVCFVYMLSMNLVDVRPEINLDIFNDPAKTSRGFGILSTKHIPSVRSFPLFIYSGQAEVKLSLIKSGVCISEEQLAHAKLFHRVVFEEALQVTKNQTFDPDVAGNSFYIVPINSSTSVASAIESWSVDWTFLVTFSTKHKEYQRKNLRNPNNNSQFAFRKEDYVDAVVVTDRGCVNDGFYYVCDINDALTPTNCMPDSNIPFATHYYEKYRQIVNNMSQPMLQVLSMRNPLVIFPSYLTLNMRRTTQRTSTKERRKIYFIPELITVHPLPASLWLKALALPCILHRLNYLLLSDQLRVETIRSFGVCACDTHTSNWPPIEVEYVVDKAQPINAVAQTEKPDFGQLPADLKCTFSVSKYPPCHTQDAVSLDEYTGPSLNLILSALTTKHATDFVDLERLELMGDAFLKFASSEYMYMTYGVYNEGKLTACKMKQIGNKKLVSLAKARNLASGLVTSKFEPRTNFLVPGFTFPTSLEKAFSKSGIPEKFWNACDLVSNLTPENVAKHVESCKRQYEKLLQAEKTDQAELDAILEGFVPFRPLTIHHISDKAIADSMEALIGAYLVTGGQDAALFFMSWLGLRVMEDTCKEEIRKGLDPESVPINKRFKKFDKPPSPLIRDDPRSFEKLSDGLDAIESKLKYDFQDKSYLIQAVTHPSYTENHITDCYERLEFLGDAILDYLITRYLYNDPEHYDPGYITDVRSALVNNSFLAELTVKYGFNQHLKYYSNELFGIVSRYLTKIVHLNCSEEEKIVQLEEEECDIPEEIQVPKILADIFEALIGAVYLDSNRNLDRVWEVICNLMGSCLDTFKKDPPKDAVRLVLEKFPDADIKVATEQISGQRYRSTIRVKGEEFQGIGSNKKLARKSACKQAYRVLTARAA